MMPNLEKLQIGRFFTKNYEEKEEFRWFFLSLMMPN